jgi:hypothetical protein
METDILESTRSFEAWLRRRIPVVEADLAYKHQQMRADPFLFFRATFYRWAELWPLRCPDLARGRSVLAVGDLHLENFGTWRDAEGRLVWGVNDFDEAHPLAFTNDLVRLAVSALLSLRGDPALKLTPDLIFAQLSDGYRAALAVGGRPFVLMEAHRKLRRMAVQQLRQPLEFWSGLEAKTTEPKQKLPDSARRAIDKLWPKGAEPIYRVVKSPKGLGSLGRRRYLAFAEWEGGRIARETKDVVPSACLWASATRAGKGNPWIEATIEAAIRAHDPLYRVKGRWLVRRLAPDCSRIDLAELKHHEDLAALLADMGWETANIHLGAPKIRKALVAAFEELPRHWLKNAAESMYAQTLRDWHDFKAVKERSLRR